MLQEMTVDTYVPNDTRIFHDGNRFVLSRKMKYILVPNRGSIHIEDAVSVFSGRISIITGPNYSGKSIYIKQVIF